MSGPCLICGITPLRLHSDHCHRHDLRRGRICPRCNALMGLIDAGKSPRVPPQALRDLTEHAARCPDCVAGKPATASTTYQLNMPIPDDMAAGVKSFADQYGITIAAAVRVLLRQALKNEEKP